MEYIHIVYLESLYSSIHPTIHPLYCVLCYKLFVSYSQSITCDWMKEKNNNIIRSEGKEEKKKYKKTELKWTERWSRRADYSYSNSRSAKWQQRHQKLFGNVATLPARAHLFYYSQALCFKSIHKPSFQLRQNKNVHQQL